MMARADSVLRVLNVVMGFLFVLAAAVQYNDPDPVRWVVIYGAAAVACWLSLRRRLRAGFVVVVGAVALVWALTIVPSVAGKVSFSQLFTDLAMHAPLVEEGRETGGLLLVAVWMAVLFTTLPRQTSR